MKIFGIGLNKTGTKTLGECFKVFGFNNKSFDMGLLLEVSRGNLDGVFNAIDMFDSFEDWPWPLLYKQLDIIYKDAKFILTVRKDPQTWFESLCRHAERTGPTEARKIAYNHEMPHKHEADHIQIYNRHNEEVGNYFFGREGKLLRICWEDGDGWGELAHFLNLPIPVIPFPHKNQRPQIVNAVKRDFHANI
jgi:hypothetical protein